MLGCGTLRKPERSYTTDRRIPAILGGLLKTVWTYMMTARLDDSRTSFEQCTVTPPLIATMAKMRQLRSSTVLFLHHAEARIHIRVVTALHLY